MSPQGEWVDLDIDLAKPHHEDGWTWNSGFVVAARIVSLIVGCKPPRPDSAAVLGCETD